MCAACPLYTSAEFLPALRQAVQCICCCICSPRQHSGCPLHRVPGCCCGWLLQQVAEQNKLCMQLQDLLQQAVMCNTTSVLLLCSVCTHTSAHDAPFGSLPAVVSKGEATGPKTLSVLPSMQCRRTTAHDSCLGEGSSWHLPLAAHTQLRHYCPALVVACSHQHSTEQAHPAKLEAHKTVRQVQSSQRHARRPRHPMF